MHFLNLGKRASYKPFRHPLAAVVALTALGVGCADLTDEGSIEDDDLIETESFALNSWNSSLWGEKGEVWTATSRLPDFSFAGYRAGAKPIPSPPVTITADATRGDDTDDDTAYIEGLLAGAASGSVIYFPAGTYYVQEAFTINKPLILRGAGPGQTIFYMPAPLGVIRNNVTYNASGHSNYAFGGTSVVNGVSKPNFFFYVRKTPTVTHRADVKADALRGSAVLTVDNDSPIVGDGTAWVRLTATDNGDGALAKHLYDETTSSTHWGVDNQGDTLVRFESRVTKVEAIDATTRKVYLERPLPVDVKPSLWTAQIETYAPLTEVGIEHLSFELAHTLFDGHFKGKGANAVYFNGVSHSWVRNVHFVNADMGLKISGSSSFITAEDVVVTTTASRANGASTAAGHHAIELGGALDCLITRFHIGDEYVHDTSVSGPARGNVWSGGSGTDMNMDHHRGAPHENLFTDIDLGAATRAWHSGGDSTDGDYSAVRGTFWNIRASQSFNLPIDAFGPRLNFIGLQTADVTFPASWQVEDSNVTVWPADLHRAMSVKRLPPAVVAVTSSNDAWVNAALTPETSRFSFTFDAVPSAVGLNAVAGLSTGTADAYIDMAAYVRWNPSGNIDARNAAGWFASAVIPYSANVKYNVRLVVNVLSRTYDAYVKPSTSSTWTTVGTGLAFRTESATATRLANFAARSAVNPSSLVVSNGKVEYVKY